MHDVADTCDNEWCIARGGASWFDYGFIGNIRCARVHVWFRIAIDGVLCAIARDVRDALDGDDECVRCGIYGVLGSIDVVMGKLCGLNDRPSCMLCDNVVASSTVYMLIRSTSDRGALTSLFCAIMNPSCQLRMQPFDHDKPPQMSCISAR